MRPSTNELSATRRGATMKRVHAMSARGRSGEQGQILVLFALVLFFAIIPMCALVLEAGNAYAQQRVVQNGADATANAGAVRLGQRLAGVATTDAEVASAMTTVSTANSLDSFAAEYTDVQGRSLNVAVGDGAIPSGAQGVAVRGTRTFPTFLGRAIGFDSFDAGADATAITGRLAGGQFLPVVLPVSIVDCTTNGSLGTVPENQWVLAQPPVAPATTPTGIEYIVPLCKTGGGSFQILDLDPSQRCDDEVANPPLVYWPVLPRVVDSDNGNNCAKPIVGLGEQQAQGQDRPHPGLRQQHRSMRDLGRQPRHLHDHASGRVLHRLHERLEQQEQLGLPEPRQWDRAAVGHHRRQRQQQLSRGLVRPIHRHRDLSINR